MAQQTAVEWLIEHLDTIYHLKDKFLQSDWEFLEEQSKKIEKKQIMDAYISGEFYPLDIELYKKVALEDAEQYYNETYNNETKNNS